MNKNKSISNGFVAIEGILILIIVIGIMGACAWSYINNAKISTKAPIISTTKLTATAGTTSSIDQLMQQDGQDENSINTKYDSNDQSAATSVDTSQTNLGGVYNESSF